MKNKSFEQVMDEVNMLLGALWFFTYMLLAVNQMVIFPLTLGAFYLFLMLARRAEKWQRLEI